MAKYLTGDKYSNKILKLKSKIKLWQVRREVEAMGFDIPKPADILFPFSLEPPRFATITATISTTAVIHQGRPS